MSITQGRTSVHLLQLLCSGVYHGGGTWSGHINIYIGVPGVLTCIISSTHSFASPLSYSFGLDNGWNCWAWNTQTRHQRTGDTYNNMNICTRWTWAPVMWHLLQQCHGALFSNLHSDLFENQELPENHYLLMFGSIPHGVVVELDITDFVGHM